MTDGNESIYDEGFEERPKMLENGLVSMEEIPEHLVAISRHNATSPLLRLPPEIRNRIWQLVLGGHHIVIETLLETYRGWATQTDNHKGTPIRSAFHLSETCRQIYAETTQLTYALNVFIFNATSERSEEAMDEWAQDRPLAHLAAIRSIKPHPANLYWYVIQPKDEPPFKEMFPGLRRIFVPKETVKAVGLARIPPGVLKKELSKALIASRIKQRDGKDMDVCFEDE